MEKIKVLIAEDSVSARKMIAMGLRISGFEVLEAEDGLVALGNVISQKPDILLLDVTMPKLTGWEVCAKVREMPQIKDLPIIITTSLNQAGDVKLAQRYGVTAYLVKPFTQEQLVQKIKETLAAPPKVDNAPKEEAAAALPAEATPEEKPFPIETQAGVAVLTLSGEVNQPQMINEAITRAFKEHSKKLLIDLSSATKIRAQCIIAISRAERLGKSLGGTVKVAMNNPEVIKDFEVAKELQFVDHYPTAAAAIESFNK